MLQRFVPFKIRAFQILQPNCHYLVTILSSAVLEYWRRGVNHHYVRLVSFAYSTITLEQKGYRGSGNTLPIFPDLFILEQKLRKVFLISSKSVKQCVLDFSVAGVCVGGSVCAAAERCPEPGPVHYLYSSVPHTDTPQVPTLLQAQQLLTHLHTVSQIWCEIDNTINYKQMVLYWVSFIRNKFTSAGVVAEPVLSAQACGSKVCRIEPCLRQRSIQLPVILL